MQRPFSFVNSSCVPNCIYVQKGSKIFLRSLRSISVGDEIKVKHSRDYFSKENIDYLCPHLESHGHGIVLLQSHTRAKPQTVGETEKPASNCKRQSRSLRKTVKHAKNSQRDADHASGKLHSSRGKQFRGTAIENIDIHSYWISSSSEQSSKASAVFPDTKYARS